MSETRYARIVAAPEQVAPFLPDNYRVVATDRGRGAQESSGALVVIIAGEDSAGWTLDDYVLPRLASGLYFGREVAHAGALPTHRDNQPG